MTSREVVERLVRHHLRSPGHARDPFHVVFANRRQISFAPRGDKMFVYAPDGGKPVGVFADVRPLTNAILAYAARGNRRINRALVAGGYRETQDDGRRVNMSAREGRRVLREDRQFRMMYGAVVPGMRKRGTKMQRRAARRSAATLTRG